MMRTKTKEGQCKEKRMKDEKNKIKKKVDEKGEQNDEKAR